MVTLTSCSLQMPRSLDLAIFVVTTDGQTDRRTDRPITLPLRRVTIINPIKIFDTSRRERDGYHALRRAVYNVYTRINGVTMYCSKDYLV